METLFLWSKTKKSLSEIFSAKTRDAEKGDAFLMEKKEIFVWLEIK